MNDPIPLQISLKDYDENDWEMLWESLLTNCTFPDRATAVENRVTYAYNYANLMIKFLKEKVEEENDV